MRITLSVLGWALLVAILLSLGFWIWDITHQFQFDHPWTELPDALWHTFHYPALRMIAVWALLKGFVPVGLSLYLLDRLDARDRTQRVVRGARIVPGKELPNITRKKPRQGEPAQVTVANVSIPYSCETSHLLLAGSTSTGKSTAVDELLESIMARGDRAIIIDPNGHALSRFAKKGDVVLNPFDTRSPGWGIFNEFRKPFDFDRIAKSIVPDTSDTSAQQWHGYAQQLLAETTRALTQTGENTTERLLHWLIQAPAADLKTLLAGSAASGLFEPGAERALASTRFILSHHVGSFQHLQPGDFSLRTWLESGTGSLYLTWREDMLSTLKPLISGWVDILIASVLTLPDDNPQPLWLMLDELASLERLSSLEAGLTKGRKHGLRVVAGLQSVAQLDAIYGQNHAKTLRSCFRNMLALGCANSDPDTAKVISDGLGQSEIERIQTTHNQNKNGASTSTHRERRIEAAVLPSELMSLPPLQGYLKLAGDYPIGKIRLVPKDRPALYVPFKER
ncbi:type IV secretion system DNA-binding domain-containing protein [Sapientia aquatica]|nr:type IV secretion system DNA-binding domain-containing protein [Sapientia aquatica]